MLQSVEGELPEFETEAVTPDLAAFDNLLFLFLFGHADHEFGGFRQRYDLLQVEEDVLTILIRRRFKTLDGDVVSEQPEHGRSDFAAEVRGDHDEALVVARVEVDFAELGLAEKVTDQLFGVLTGLGAVEVVLKIETMSDLESDEQ